MEEEKARVSSTPRSPTISDNNDFRLAKERTSIVSLLYRIIISLIYSDDGKSIHLSKKKREREREIFSRLGRHTYISFFSCKFHIKNDENCTFSPLYREEYLVLLVSELHSCRQGRTRHIGIKRLVLSLFHSKSKSVFFLSLACLPSIHPPPSPPSSPLKSKNTYYSLLFAAISVPSLSLSRESMSHLMAPFYTKIKRFLSCFHLIYWTVVFAHRNQ